MTIPTPSETADRLSGCLAAPDGASHPCSVRGTDTLGQRRDNARSSYPDTDCFVPHGEKANG